MCVADGGALRVCNWRDGKSAKSHTPEFTRGEMG